MALSFKHWLPWSVLTFSKWNCTIIQPDYHFPLQKSKNWKGPWHLYSASVWQNLPMEDSSNPHETNICQKKPRLSLLVKKKFNFTESGIFEIFMEGNWKSMSGSISIQSCSSNIISKSHNLARKTRLESFSIFWCSCCL